jgi:hypothetical protein
MEQNNETKVTEKTVVSQDTVKSFDPVFDNEIKAAIIYFYRPCACITCMYATVIAIIAYGPTM